MAIIVGFGGDGRVSEEPSLTLKINTSSVILSQTSRPSPNSSTCTCRPKYLGRG